MKKKKSGIYHTSDLPINRKGVVEVVKERILGVMVKHKGMNEDEVKIVSGEEYGEKRDKELKEKLKKFKLDPERKKRIPRMELGDLPVVRKKK